LLALASETRRFLFLMELHSKPASLSFTAKEIWKRKTKKFRFLFCKPAGA